MSEHKVEVVEVKLEKHPNADSLSVVRVGDYTVCARTQDWHDGQLAAYIEPDYMVPSERPEFNFLGASGSKEIENNGVRGYRIKCKRLRGVMSMGLLVPAPSGAVVGDDVMGYFGIARYEPKIQSKYISGGDCVSPPPGYHSKYDIESAYKYAGEFVDGEEVVVTEKIHGANAKFHFAIGDGMYCGSRTEWKKESINNLWWSAIYNTVGLQEWCESHPDLVVYGEVYGQVQDLKYGATKGEVCFAAFDIRRLNGDWLDHDEARAIYPLEWVPLLYRGPWNKEAMFALADGDSAVAANRGVKQIREGIVIKPIKERRCDSIGRVQVKIVSNSYLERA